MCIMKDILLEDLDFDYFCRYNNGYVIFVWFFRFFVKDVSQEKEFFLGYVFMILDMVRIFIFYSELVWLFIS